MDAQTHEWRNPIVEKIKGRESSLKLVLASLELPSKKEILYCN